MTTRCAVVGAGAWGTALANVLAANGHATSIWARERDVVESISREHVNLRFLDGVVLDASLEAHHDVGAVVANASLVTLAPPSHVLREVARTTAAALAPGAIIVVATKGIERGSLAVMSDIVREELPDHDVVALSGPSFAIEVAQGQPTAVVAASTSENAAVVVQQTFSSSTLRVYTHDDVLGVELGGALKNVMAVATGIAEGLGLGFNSRAALITRGLAEMTRLGVALGAQRDTFAGLAGLGDLVLTCTGALSRNRALGQAIGEGRTLEQALEGKETVAEGVWTTASAAALADREGIDMPIVSAVQRILFEGRAARAAIAELMKRELRPELD